MAPLRALKIYSEMLEQGHGEVLGDNGIKLLSKITRLLELK